MITLRPLVLLITVLNGIYALPVAYQSNLKTAPCGHDQMNFHTMEIGNSQHYFWGPEKTDQGSTDDNANNNRAIPRFISQLHRRNQGIINADDVNVGSATDSQQQGLRRRAVDAKKESYDANRQGISIDGDNSKGDDGDDSLGGSGNGNGNGDGESPNADDITDEQGPNDSSPSPRKKGGLLGLDAKLNLLSSDNGNDGLLGSGNGGGLLGGNSDNGLGGVLGGGNSNDGLGGILGGGKSGRGSDGNNDEQENQRGLLDAVLDINLLSGITGGNGLLGSGNGGGLLGGLLRRSIGDEPRRALFRRDTSSSLLDAMVRLNLLSHKNRGGQIMDGANIFDMANMASSNDAQGEAVDNALSGLGVGHQPLISADIMANILDLIRLKSMARLLRRDI